MTDIKIIKERQRKLFFSGYFQKYSVATVKDDIELVKGDRDDLYLYPDIDYSDTDRSVWKAGFHYYRMELQLIKSGTDRVDNDPEWRKKMLGALRYWIEKDFINQNWWQNQIGMPLVMANLAIVFEKYLTDDLANGLKKLISRGTFHAHEGINEIAELMGTTKSKTADAWTGANLVWGASTTIRYALWLEDAELLRIAIDRLSEEIKISAEGIQADGAFCQHGPRWYSGGYGRSFVFEIAPILNILRGTKFALPKEKTDLIMMHILGGQRMMMRKGYFDFGAVGREYTRPEAIYLDYLKRALPLIAEDDTLDRKDELSEFCSELEAGIDLLEKTKYYDSIAQLCHKKNGIYIGIRGRKEGVFGAEMCNSEGNLSYNMTYGTVSCIMESGKEYFDISPIWDYSRIPGTTARIEKEDELLKHGEWWSMLETPCRAFGKANGECGAMAQFTAHDGISLTAAYFVFDGTLVALGTDIRDEAPEKGRLQTNVEQCIASDTEHGKNMARNGRIIYRNLDLGTEFVSSTAVQSGSWKKNNAALPDDAIDCKIFSVSIPVTSYGKYAYSASLDECRNIKIINNDSDCQAILVDGKKLMALFYNDFSLNFGERKVKGKKGDIILD
ncbi:MAG: hypothetical protein IKJ91_09795 [Clostridia bacterium]|nr:hypothetical protein [Clostridia bacterium]